MGEGSIQKSSDLDCSDPPESESVLKLAFCSRIIIEFHCKWEWRDIYRGFLGPPDWFWLWWTTLHSNHIGWFREGTWKMWWIETPLSDLAPNCLILSKSYHVLKQRITDYHSKSPPSPITIPNEFRSLFHILAIFTSTQKFHMYPKVSYVVRKVSHSSWSPKMYLSHSFPNSVRRLLYEFTLSTSNEETFPLFPMQVYIERKKGESWWVTWKIPL